MYHGRKPLVRVTAVLLFLGWIGGMVGLAQAGTTGKIIGVVKDQATGLPLPNANVSLIGTTIGATAGAQGDFFILNVPGGTYDIKATIVGYKDLVQTGVIVVPDFTNEVLFTLEPTVAAVMEELTVKAEKPIIQRDRTGTARFLAQEDLQNQPIRGYQDAASLQAGVVSVGRSLAAAGVQIEESTNTPRLYIRGGRSNEVAYYVDGFSQQDPLTGISTTAINQNAIDQVVVMTGGFDAEYGRIMSGVVNVVTREGADRYFGSAEVLSDVLSGEWLGTEVYDYNVYNGSFGGPVPAISSMNFLFSGERTWQRDRDPRPIKKLGLDAEDKAILFEGGERNNGLSEEQAQDYVDGILPNNSLSGYSGQGKLAWDVNPNMKVKVGGLGSRDNWQEYRHAYLFDIRHTPRYEDTNESAYGSFTHTISPNSFYELAGSWFFTERFRGDGIHFKDLLAYGRPDGNPDFDPTSPLFFYGDSTYASGGTVWDDYLHRESSYFGLRGDLTTQWREAHTAKAGIEWRRHTLRRYNHLFPVNVYKGEQGGFVDLDAYGYDRITQDEIDSGLDGAKHPSDLGIYLQDKYEVDDFVVRGGVRLDYLNPNTERLVDDAHPLGADNTSLDPEDLEDSKAYTKISPRLGVGFPVSDRTLFHANYGKFFQQPNLEDLYVSYTFLEHKVKTGGYFAPFGNPSLKPEETTAYEFGFSKQVSPQASFDLGIFYKDVRNLVQVQNINASPNSYSSFRNTDFATIKGVDLSFDLRRTHNVQSSVYYTLQFAKGTGSASQTGRNAAWQATQTPKLTSPLDFDQRHKITVNVDWRTQKGEGPAMSNGWHPLENAGVNVLFNVGSGLPYTAALPHDEVTLASITPSLAGSLNDRTGPWTMRFDLKADRGFSLGGLNMNGYVWVLNLFNRRNPDTVFQSTGDALSTGWLAEPTGEASYSTDRGRSLYDLKQRSPNRFDTPRVVRFGLRAAF